MEKQKTLFLRRLGYLLNASVPLDEAFRMARRRAKGAALIKALDASGMSITKGSSLSQGLAGMFDPTTLMTVHMGELSGTLGTGVLDAAAELERRKKLKQEMLSALLYPCIVSVFAFFLILLLLGYVYPQIMPIFSSLRVDLPLSTRMVMSASVLVRKYWLWVLITLPVSLFCSSFALKEFRKRSPERYARSRRMLESALLATPFVGDALILFELSRSARVLSVALRDADYVGALALAERSSRFFVFKDIFRRAGAAMEEGRSLGAFFTDERPSGFPSLWADMLSIGEKTGRLAESLGHIAVMHEEDVRERVTMAAKLIEPALMICTGSIVAMIALSIITPLYGLTNNLYAK